MSVGTFIVSQMPEGPMVLAATGCGLVATLLTLHIQDSAADGRRVRALRKDIAELTDRMQSLLSQLAGEYATAHLMIALMQQGIGVLPPDRAVSVWLELLWQTRRRFWSVSYLDPDSGWDSRFAELAVEIQGAKVQVDQIDARRLYMLDDVTELAVLAETITKQVAAGIQVRWILRSTVESNPMLLPLLTKLASHDICLIDSSTIFRLNLDHNRAIESEQISHAPDECRALEGAYRLLFEVSNRINPTQLDSHAG